MTITVDVIEGDNCIEELMRLGLHVTAVPSRNNPGPGQMTLTVTIDDKKSLKTFSDWARRRVF